MSELHREAELADRNELRRIAWIERYKNLIGFTPNGTQTSIIAHQLGCERRGESVGYSWTVFASAEAVEENR